MHAGEVLGKYDPFPAPRYEDFKDIPALDNHMRYGKKRAQYRRAFLFSFDEHLLESCLFHIELFPQTPGNKIEKILLFHGPLDI